MIWVPPSPDLNIPVIAGNYIEARKAIDDFLNGELTPEDYLDRIEHYGVDVDEYLETLEFNAIHNL